MFTLPRSCPPHLRPRVQRTKRPTRRRSSWFATLVELLVSFALFAGVISNVLGLSLGN